MNTQKVNQVLAEIFKEIAPEIDYSVINPEKSLRDQVEIDSYDFYRIIVKVAKQTGVNIPDSKLAQMKNLQDLVNYLVRSVPVTSPDKGENLLSR